MPAHVINKHQERTMLFPTAECEPRSGRQEEAGQGCLTETTEEPWADWYSPKGKCKQGWGGVVVVERSRDFYAVPKRSSLIACQVQRNSNFVVQKTVSM